MILTKKDIYNFVVNNVKEFYFRRGFSEEEIRNKLGEPQIFLSSNDGGEINLLNQEMDEHIIICEFVGDFKPISVMIDG